MGSGATARTWLSNPLADRTDIVSRETNPMKKTIAAANPDAYVEALSGWQRTTVENLRAAVVASAKLDEVIKWGHLVYLSNGPVLLIRAEESRVLFGLWRGKRLREIEERLKPGGKYEMANIVLHENEEIRASVVKRLTKAAIALNEKLGDPTDI
jgi:hypothetical protein